MKSLLLVKSFLKIFESSTHRRKLSKTKWYPSVLPTMYTMYFDLHEVYYSHLGFRTHYSTTYVREWSFSDIFRASVLPTCVAFGMSTWCVLCQKVTQAPYELKRTVFSHVQVWILEFRGSRQTLRSAQNIATGRGRCWNRWIKELNLFRISINEQNAKQCKN